MPGILQDKDILLGVSGGIAAYKAADLARRLVAAGARVQVVMTAAAREFITPLTFTALTGREAKGALFGPGAHPLEHVSLGQECHAVVLAPATANLIGKIAAGLGDDLLTTILLAATAPVLVCPAMNVKMWDNPVVQRNLEDLTRRGYAVLPPAVGEMACGAQGAGRLPEPADIVEALAALLTPKDLTGLTLLVSAGPTHEDLDPVRFLTNRSTGKMGYALARMAQRRGARVVLVSGPSALPAPVGVERLMVRTALEMQRVLVERFAAADAVVMAAAVSDYRPAAFAATKIKRGSEEMLLTLQHNPDLIADLGRRKHKQVLVGFAAETDDLIAHAQQKLEKKHLDLIVANDVSRPGSGFAVDTNEVTLLFADGRTQVCPLLPKEEVADRVLDHLAALVRRVREEGRHG